MPRVLILYPVTAYGGGGSYSPQQGTDVEIFTPFGAVHFHKNHKPHHDKHPPEGMIGYEGAPQGYYPPQQNYQPTGPSAPYVPQQEQILGAAPESNPQAPPPPPPQSVPQNQTTTKGDDGTPAPCPADQSYLSYDNSAFQLNAAKDITGLDFKPDGHGHYVAKIQGIFRNGFEKAFNEAPAPGEELNLAQKALGSNAFQLSDDKQHIILNGALTQSEVDTYINNESVIGRLKHGDLKRAHEIAATHDLGIYSTGTQTADCPPQVQQDTTPPPEEKKKTETTAPIVNPEVHETPPPPAPKAPEQHFPDSLKFEEMNGQDSYQLAQIMGETLMRNHVALQDGKAITHSINDGHHYGFDGTHGLNTETMLRQFKQHDEKQPHANGELDRATFFELAQKFQQYEKSQGHDIGNSGSMDKATFEAAIREEKALSEKYHISIGANNSLDAVGKALGESQQVSQSSAPLDTPGAPGSNKVALS